MSVQEKDIGNRSTPAKDQRSYMSGPSGFCMSFVYLDLFVAFLLFFCICLKYKIKASREIYITFWLKHLYFFNTKNKLIF